MIIYKPDHWVLRKVEKLAGFIQGGTEFDCFRQANVILIIALFFWIMSLVASLGSARHGSIPFYFGGLALITLGLLYSDQDSRPARVRDLAIKGQRNPLERKLKGLLARVYLFMYGGGLGLLALTSASDPSPEMRQWGSMDVTVYWNVLTSSTPFLLLALWVAYLRSSTPKIPQPRQQMATIET
jgi:hypothetical protein